MIRDRHSRFSRRAAHAPQTAATLVGAALVLAGCAELGGQPVTPPSPLATDRDPALAAQAEADLTSGFESGCLRADFELSDSADRLSALGFAPSAPAGGFERLRKGAVLAELRRGPSQPMQASNCLLTSAQLSPRAARAAATRAMAASGLPYRAIGPEEARTLSPDGAVVGLLDAPDFAGLIRVVDTVVDGKAAAGLAYLRTR